MLSLRQRRLNRLRHLELALPEFVIWMRLRKNAAPREKAPCVQLRLRTGLPGFSKWIEMLTAAAGKETSDKQECSMRLHPVILKVGPRGDEIERDASMRSDEHGGRDSLSFELLGIKVYDLKGRHIGTLRDAALVPLIDPVRVDRYLVAPGPAGSAFATTRSRPSIQTASASKMSASRHTIPTNTCCAWCAILLDQQIIDAQGRKVVRVNDVTFSEGMENGQRVLHILEVDIGVRSIVASACCAASCPPTTIRRIQSHIPPHSIRWEFCNILEADPQRRVRLNISNKLLENMHPADLADIVENLGHEDRAGHLQQHGQRDCRRPAQRSRSRTADQNHRVSRS